MRDSLRENRHLLLPKIYVSLYWVRGGMCEAAVHQPRRVILRQWSALWIDPYLRISYRATDENREHIQHLADNCGACYLYKYDMIQSNAIEAVEKSERALNLIGLDHALQQVFHGKFLSLSRKIICNGKNSTQIV
jgi:hypothetical protein